MIKYKNIETERLILKPTNIEDAKFMLALVNSPKWMEFIGDREVYSEADAEKYIETRMLPQLKKLGFGNFTIIRKEDNAKMGCCGLYDREGIDGLDIGFSFLPEFERKGYAFEASEKLKNTAFNSILIKSSVLKLQKNLKTLLLINMELKKFQQ